MNEVAAPLHERPRGAVARSWLIHPVDAGAVIPAGADAVIVDLGDRDGSARDEMRQSLRSMLRGWPERARRPLVFVRVGDSDDDVAGDALAAAACGVDGLASPRTTSGADVQRLAAMSAVAEAECGLDHGALAIVATIESGAGLLDLASLRGASRRLVALAWDGERLAADIGATAAREPDGGWIGPCAVARTLVLAAAAAAGVPAIDAAFRAPGAGALATESAAARRDGFSAKLANEAAQIPEIAAAFA